MRNLLDKIIQLFKKGAGDVLELWPIKIFISCISSAGCYLFGGSEAILGAVIVFIALDTLTKWVAITRKYLIDTGHADQELTATSIVCGFFYAWKPGYLTSTDLRRHWGEKMFTYVVLIIAASMVAKLPDIVLFGTPVNKSLSGGIYTYILMTELFSIVENLEEMGNSHIAQLKQIFCVLVTKITGSNFAVTLSTTDKEDKK